MLKTWRLLYSFLGFSLEVPEKALNLVMCSQGPWIKLRRNWKRKEDEYVKLIIMQQYKTKKFLLDWGTQRGRMVPVFGSVWLGTPRHTHVVLDNGVSKHKNSLSGQRLWKSLEERQICLSGWLYCLYSLCASPFHLPLPIHPTTPGSHT